MAGQASAVSWFDSNTHIRVYTSKGNEVTEQCWDGNGPWYKGAYAGAGATVGATSWVNGGQIFLRVYSTVGNKIVEQCWDKDRWYTGSFAAAGESASATSWLDDSHTLHLRVYVRATDGSVTEQCWDGSGPWHVGAYKGAA
jgi:hypothetical protein